MPYKNECDPVEKQFVSVTEAAKILCLSPKTIYRQIRNGQIPFLRVGNQFKIPIKYFELNK